MLSGAQAEPQSRKRLLDQVLADYLDAMTAGPPPDRSALLAGYPEVAPDLEEFFSHYEQFRVLGEARDMRAPAIPPPERLGDYELLDVIARGGMGVVYKARQGSLDRNVALKVIADGPLADTTDRERFRIEAEAGARLDHPNIVPVYEQGEWKGNAYFTMELIEGGSLAEHGGRFRKRPREAARLVEIVARAVHHAHERGVLHRDLKPANILLDEEGNPHVTDFGLAKLLTSTEGKGSLTETGAIVGTADYMAPEQLDGTSSKVTTSCDVYGLGALLYELATGRRPFQGTTVLNVLDHIRTRDPRRPTSVNRRVDRDLEIICLKCLEKDPEKRYPSAEALADDLRRYLDGRPIHARPAGLRGKVSKWARRQPACAALVAVTCLAIASLFTLGIWYDARLRQALATETRLCATDEHAATSAARERDTPEFRDHSER